MHLNFSHAIKARIMRAFEPIEARQVNGLNHRRVTKPQIKKPPDEWVACWDRVR
jgi:hypothetical protein